MVDKGNGEYIPTPKKKLAPSTKPKVIIPAAPAAPPSLVSLEQMTEEELLALALEVYTNTALEE